jgi:hypothetical protein
MQYGLTLAEINPLAKSRIRANGARRAHVDMEAEARQHSCSRARHRREETRMARADPLRARRRRDQRKPITAASPAT